MFDYMIAIVVIIKQWWARLQK